MWGFHKIGTDKWEFANEDFLRGDRALLKHISRRRTSQVHQNSTHAVSSSSLGMGKGHLVEDEIAKLKKEKDSLMQEIIQLRQENVLNFGRLESLNDRLSSAEVRQRQMVSFLAKVLRNPVFIGHLRRLKEQRGIEYATRAKRKFLRHCSSSLSASSAITLNDTTESDNGKQKQASDDRLKNVSENIEVDICGESSQSFKGKTIMKEMDAMDPIFSASEDDYLLSLPENIIINSESEVERNTHENLLFSDAIVPTNDGGVDEAWDGLDVGTGENLLSGDNAWDMNLADYSNDQNSLWDVGLNAAEDDLDIDKYIAGASLLEEFKIGAQLNQDPKL